MRDEQSNNPTPAFRATVGIVVVVLLLGAFAVWGGAFLIVADLGATLWSAHERWGVDPDALAPARAFASAATAGDYVASAADTPGDAHLRDDLELVADTFRRFATERIAPQAEHIHRQDLDIPRDIIDGVAALRAADCDGVIAMGGGSALDAGGGGVPGPARRAERQRRHIAHVELHQGPLARAAYTQSRGGRKSVRSAASGVPGTMSPGRPSRL